jgi:hypothetical protein
MEAVADDASAGSLFRSSQARHSLLINPTPPRLGRTMRLLHGDEAACRFAEHLRAG